MLTGDVRPTTLRGIKSLATQLKKERNIPHTAALDLAARQAGFTNFRNAQTKQARGVSRKSHYVFLTRYWMDDETSQRGRETLRVELAKPILDICDKYTLKIVRGFGDLRMAAEDHFVSDSLAHSQSSARKDLCKAARSVLFMDCTGLRPTREWQRAYPSGDARDKLPYSDHTTDWIDPETGQFILVDEPYHNPANDDERNAWASRNGWRIIQISWPGMYFPYHADLFIASEADAEYDLDDLAAEINAMPPPLTSDDWAGDSSDTWDTFVSPLATTPNDIRRARSKGTILPMRTRSTVPYSYQYGSRRRRPDGELGVEGHQEAGRILKAILNKTRQAYVSRHLNSVRSTLEDWLSLEIGRSQLQGPEFFQVYYQKAAGDERWLEKAGTPAGILSMLTELREKLARDYPDCAPLREQLSLIDKAATIIATKNTG